jgi:hypothetical protein
LAMGFTGIRAYMRWSQVQAWFWWSPQSRALLSILVLIFLFFIFIPVIPGKYPLGVMGNFERQSREMPTCASVLFYEMAALCIGKLRSCNVPSNYTTSNQCRSLHPPVILLYAIEHSLYLAQYFLTLTVW